LVGDNPFHGISHLSQDRSRARGSEINQVDFAAKLVREAFKNGADGFMFSVSKTTLSILEAIRKSGEADNLNLYAIVPYAYEYVRLAAQTGGMSGLAKKMAKEVIFSRNLKAIAMGAKAVIKTDLTALMKAYLFYEISRIKSSTGRTTNLKSVLLHEMITEMALSFGLDWFFKSYIEFVLGLNIQPGFETRNFAYLVRKFKDWDIDFREIMITTSFNRAGFQMNPSRIECEKALAEIGESSIIAMSILAAGYLKLPEAVNYIEGLPNLSGVVVGVSKERHARETFALLRRQL
jgi:hypothetical protein